MLNKKNNQREVIANLCHRQWSGWMEYLFKQSYELFGVIIIPRWAVKRWKRQINTPYEQLSKLEKDSDRKQADRFIKLL